MQEEPMSIVDMQIPNYRQILMLPPMRNKQSRGKKILPNDLQEVS